MKNLIPLMQREWLQHRFAWALLMLVPFALAVMLLSFGHIEMNTDFAARSGADLAAMLGMLSVTLSMGVLFLLVWVASLFVTSTLARRDHGDRSVEFWLSLPTGHAESLAAPLLVHLVLVPAAALLVGMIGGYAISLLVVSRYVGLGEWFAMPWGNLLAATIALAGRVLAGLPLAVLWLSPLILLAVICNALFKRWGLPVLAVGLGLGSVVMEFVFGQPLLGQALSRLGRAAGLSLAGASGQGVSVGEQTEIAQALQGLPAWAAQDLWAAVQQTASPAFLAALVVSAALFAALVWWRARGAGLAS